MKLTLAIVFVLVICGVVYRQKADVPLIAAQSRQSAALHAAADAETTAKLEADLAAHRYWLGMTAPQAEKSLGRPARKEISVDAAASIEKWHYVPGPTLVMQDGKLIRYELGR